MVYRFPWFYEQGIFVAGATWEKYGSVGENITENLKRVKDILYPYQRN